MVYVQQGIDLLADITDNLYTKNNTKYSKSGIGRHFRHIIEHYYSFLEAEADVIDYDDRERNIRLETDRDYMISELKKVKIKLSNYEKQPELLDKPIKIRSNEGIGEEDSPLSSATRRRELQFLISHTVHHYALIGLILQTLGYLPQASFGVAPSTLKFEMENESLDKAL
jgi:uncharacterized damage-inducible protein DinB